MPPVRTTSESSSGLDIKSNEAVFLRIPAPVEINAGGKQLFKAPKFTAADKPL
jgi:hypothetical protein